MKLTRAQIEARKLLIDPEKYYIMLYGGSRSGKTFLLVRSIFIRAMRAKSRHCILRKAFKHAKRSLCFDTIPKVLALCFPGLEVPLNKTDWFYKLPNGSEIWIGGLDDAERVEAILGNEYSTMYYNECSQMSWDSVETGFSRLAEESDLRKVCYFDENPPSKKHWSYLFFIEHINPEDRTSTDSSSTGYFLMNPEDNKENLPESYFKIILDSMSQRKQKRFKKGLFSDDTEGSLWKSADIEENRVSYEHFSKTIWDNLRYIVVGVDPAVSNNPDSDEHGIIVAGVSIDGHYYIFDDCTLRGSPLQWGQAVIGAYDDWSANKIIAEKNQGGDLVKSNIQNVDKSKFMKIELIHASRAKHIRAEPVVALYEQGKVHHVEILPDLEDEMTSWNPLTDSCSPNRIDALVWALFGLGVKNEISSSYLSGIL